MILVDTSVLIDLFRGESSPAVELLHGVTEQNLSFGITSVIYQELLQGAKTDKEFSSLKEYLSTQLFYHPLNPLDSYERAAEIYFSCRRQGVTIRSTIDCLIAQIALEHDLYLLHNDRDFDVIAPIVGLKIYRQL